MRCERDLTHYCWIWQWRKGRRTRNAGSLWKLEEQENGFSLTTCRKKPDQPTPWFWARDTHFRPLASRIVRKWICIKPPRVGLLEQPQETNPMKKIKTRGKVTAMIKPQLSSNELAALLPLSPSQGDGACMDRGLVVMGTYVQKPSN